MENPSSSKYISRIQSLWLARHNRGHADDILPNKATKAKENKHLFLRNKKDMALEKPNSSKNSSQRRLSQGRLEPTRKKPDRPEFKKTMKVQQTKRNPIKSKKELDAIYNSLTQTKKHFRVPIMHTKILNYLVSNQARNQNQEKKHTKKAVDINMKNKKFVGKNSLDKTATKSKSKRLKILDSPDKSSSEKSFRRSRRQRNPPVVKLDEKPEKKNKSKLKISDKPPDKNSSEMNTKKLRRGHSLVTYPTEVKYTISNKLKRKVRSQVWRMSKNSIKANEHWRTLLERNNIIIDNINPKEIDKNIINIEALGIENKLLKRTLTWLLK